MKLILFFIDVLHTQVRQVDVSRTQVHQVEVDVPSSLLSKEPKLVMFYILT